MPFVRIDLPASISPERALRAGDAVHRAMGDVIAVPADDRFQVLARHGEGVMVSTPEYLGVRHTNKVLFIQINLSPGRTVQQKRQLFARIATDVSEAADVSPADVIVHLVETHRENWSFGEGVAHYTL
ncbi:tautomerase family protein [Ramlibacter albus]|uniref:Tautomerase family protein n=1 Tax=Ramlibacter albus TaxID=2079448 RepID=A0A923S238_9BURK|nr:tautomerase family protein [Ramlibacter albus]MBC5765079.1 tautomerase family protein [Ramlibacter albus]